MSQTKISRETKSNLLTEVRNGRSLAPFYFSFLGSDISFTESLLAAANENNNESFLDDLREFIVKSSSCPSGSDGKTSASNITKKELKINLSPQVFDKKNEELLGKLTDAIERVKKAKSAKYNPTGQSVQQFIDSKNAGTGTGSAWFGMVSGGLPSLGKRSK